MPPPTTTPVEPVPETLTPPPSSTQKTMWIIIGAGIVLLLIVVLVFARPSLLGRVGQDTVATSTVHIAHPSPAGPALKSRADAEAADAAADAFKAKVDKIRNDGPAYVQAHPDTRTQLESLVQQLRDEVQAQDYTQANATADHILQIMGE